MASCVSIPDQNRIYVIGGRTSDNLLSEDIEKYDASYNTWTIINIQNPILSCYAGACLLPNSPLILIFGGKNVNLECQKECYFYNYENNQVTSANPMSGQWNHVVNIPVVIGNKVYSYFYKLYGHTREFSVYDIQTGIWSVEA